MKIRILKKSKDDLNVYTVKNIYISYEELEGLLNTYDKVIIPRLNWNDRGIRSLPENFGNLKVEGNLNLRYNKLTSLPESFGNLEVKGGLYLMHNQLTSLPESFGDLEVGGDLTLSFNQLTSLPESFADIKVRDKLWLVSNPWIIDTDFVNFCEKYKGELVLDDELKKAITIFLKQQKKLEEWEE